MKNPRMWLKQQQTIPHITINSINRWYKPSNVGWATIVLTTLSTFMDGDFHDSRFQNTEIPMVIPEKSAHGQSKPKTKFTSTDGEIDGV